MSKIVVHLQGLLADSNDINKILNRAVEDIVANTIARDIVPRDSKDILNTNIIIMDEHSIILDDREGDTSTSTFSVSHILRYCFTSVIYIANTTYRELDLTDDTIDCIVYTY